MDRILLVGGAMVAIGLGLAGIWLVIYSSGDTFEMIQDSVVRWLDRA